MPKVYSLGQKQNIQCIPCLLHIFILACIINVMLNSPMAFQDLDHQNTVFYYYLSMMLSKDPQVTQSCVATSKRLHMEFYALVSRNCHRNVAGNSYALIFKVPVINYGRVTGTQSLEV